MPKTIYEIDGQEFSNLEEFYDVVSRVLIPGAEWGGTLMPSMIFCEAVLELPKADSSCVGRTLQNRKNGWPIPKLFASLRSG